LITDLLIVGQTGQSGAFNGRDVHENILAAGVGRNETETLCRVEPFYGASGHSVSPLTYLPAATVRRAPCSLGISVSRATSGRGDRDRNASCRPIKCPRS